VFYVLDGDDAFSRNEELRALISRTGDPEVGELNTTYLDGRSTDLNEIRHHCDSLPLLGERRLVIITGLLERLSQTGKERAFGQAGGRLLQDLLQYLPQLPATTRLILVEEATVPKRHPVIALAQQSGLGHIKTSDLPAGDALLRWTRKRVRLAGGEIEPAAAETLCTYVGNDLHQLDQEIQKLVAYTDGARSISEADVRELTPQARMDTVFDMVDAMGHRDGRTAIRIYRQLLDDGKDPLELLGMIVRQFRLMIQTKELAPTLGTAEAIARELGQRSSYPIKKILGQSDNYTIPQLHRIYHRLLETDMDIKTGRVEATLALDTLIAGLSRAA
jgi:DNA polymerase-3 subunit delta